MISARQTAFREEPSAQADFWSVQAGIKLSIICDPNPRIAKVAKHTPHFFVSCLAGVLFARSGFLKCELGASHS
jgi:hypothetical protein